LCRAKKRGGANMKKILLVGVIIILAVFSYKKIVEISINDHINSAFEKSGIQTITAYSNNGLELLENNAERQEFSRSIVGKIKNNSSKKWDLVEVYFNLYDKDGVLIGTTWDKVTKFEPGVIWKFEAKFYKDEATSYKLKEMNAYMDN